MSKVIKNIIFLGMPGSGKGTISSKLEKTIDIKQVSTGDIFREEIKNQTPLGVKVKQVVESGQYVPDDITNEIVKNKINELESKNQKFILDGFPRTTAQAQFIETLKMSPYIVINLEIDKEVVIKRLSERRFCPQCKKTYNLSLFKSKKHPYCENDETLLIQRADDQPEAIIKRLEVYEEQTAALIQYYKDKSQLISIKSDENIDIIINTIKGLVEHND